MWITSPSAPSASRPRSESRSERTAELLSHGGGPVWRPGNRGPRDRRPAGGRRRRGGAAGAQHDAEHDPDEQQARRRRRPAAASAGSGHCVWATSLRAHGRWVRRGGGPSPAIFFADRFAIGGGSYQRLRAVRDSAKSGFFALDHARPTRLGWPCRHRWTHGFVGGGIFLVRAIPSDAFSSVRWPDGHRHPHRLLPSAPSAPGSSLRATDSRASLETTMKALASDALASSNQTFLDLARSQLEQLQQKTTHELDERKQAVEHLVGPIKESLSKVDGKLQELEVARTRAYSDLSTQVRVACRGPEGSAKRDREPRQRAARPPERARPLGRDPAAPRRRDGRHGRALRLRDAASRHDRRRPAAARPRREAPGREDGRRRREVRRPGVSRVAAVRERRGPCGEAARPRAAGARPRREALGEELLVAVRRDAGVRRALHPGRDVPERRARAGPRADRGRCQPAGDPRDADDADRAPARGRVRLAPGDDRRVRKGDQRARPRALHAARHAHRAFRQGRPRPRDCGQVVQRDRRLTRDARPARAPASSRSTASPPPASSSR